MGDFEKKFPASACRKKKIVCSTNVIEKNSCTAVKKYPTHQVGRKKNLADHKSPTHPLKSQMVGPLTGIFSNCWDNTLLPIMMMMTDNEALLGGGGVQLSLIPVNLGAFIPYP